MLARKQGLLSERSITLDIEDDLPLAYVDSAMLETALSQLMENALKYSPLGSRIVISASRTGDTIQIKVIDQGEGLAFGESEKIFERFYRSQRHAGAISGSGLGLWIARALIEACDGHVHASSLGQGRGTTLQIDLPVRAQPASDEHIDE
jgi:two-component system, OmpR family, sensor histidine kinase KdpD